MTKYYYPPAPGNGAGTFSDNLVGLQFTNGSSQMTTANFSSFGDSGGEKTNRNFELGGFSAPITLDSLSTNQPHLNQHLLNSSLQITFNYDDSIITDQVLYGSMKERFRVATNGIVGFFPGALYMSAIDITASTSGNSVESISYDTILDRTTIEVSKFTISNPFNIEYTVNGLKEVISNNDIELDSPVFNGISNTAISAQLGKVSPLRNFSKEYTKYSLSFSGQANEKEYALLDYSPITEDETKLRIIIKGAPFGTTATTTTKRFYIKPNSEEFENAFENFDSIQKFLLNRNTTPQYTAEIQITPTLSSGEKVKTKLKVSWPKIDLVNLDINTSSYDSYLASLVQIADEFDEVKTNLVSRFLTSESLTEFDTIDRKVEKTLQIYGRSFDNVKRFIDGIAYMTNVTYDGKNNIPNNLLKNFARMLGWRTPSSISKVAFLDTILQPGEAQFSGETVGMTPAELDIEMYRRILMNTAYLFKSKGTRKAVEFLLRFIGAPPALVEFNEYVVLADNKINLNQFNSLFATISGGSVTYSGVTIETGMTPTNNMVVTTSTTQTHGFSRSDYPIDNEGYPTKPEETSSYFFQRGAGWYEQTPEHHGETVVDLQNSIFSGCSPDIVTMLNPFTWGGFFGDGSKSNDPSAPYLERFRRFPLMNYGYGLTKEIDDKKSWLKIDEDNEIREYNFNNERFAFYQTFDERLVLNVKNVDLFLNIGQGLAYDVWQQSVLSGCPFSGGVLDPSVYSSRGGNDSTHPEIDAADFSFKKFVEGFWKVYINVKNRMTIDDGKTGGYPNLQQIYINYLAQHCGSNNQYTYQKMIDYSLALGDYWIKLIEQLLPATTLWQGGIKYKNSVFHRDKFVYKNDPASASTINQPISSQTETNYCIPCPFSGAVIDNTIPTQVRFSANTCGDDSSCCELCSNNLLGTFPNGNPVPEGFGCKSTWFQQWTSTYVTTPSNCSSINNNIRILAQNFLSNSMSISSAYNFTLPQSNNNVMVGEKFIEYTNPLPPWGYNYIVK